jgi:CDP-glycerol glycerophosphotransferase (TagB/SpsB family)
MFENTKADLFVCGAKPEYEFVKSTFGYPEGNVQYTGFARFDNLHENTTKNQILVMPTWRKWIPSSTWKSENLEECREIFLKSEYFDRYNSLINNQKLIDLLEQYNLELIFYPHYEMQVYVDLFKTQSDRVIIAKKDEYDVQQLLKESKILITDYSSVAFDFAYMRKPVIYYQFDNDIYYKGHYQKGYFDYNEHGFGPVVYECKNIVQGLNNLLNKQNQENNYNDRYEQFFPLYDKDNCERIYNYVIQM